MHASRASLILAALVACVAPVVRADEATAVDLNEKGLRLAQSKRFEEAVRAFEEAVRAAPTDETIRGNLGRCESNWGVDLLGKGEFVAAELATRRARDLLP